VTRQNKHVSFSDDLTIHLSKSERYDIQHDEQPMNSVSCPEVNNTSESERKTLFALLSRLCFVCEKRKVSQATANQVLIKRLQELQKDPFSERHGVKTIQNQSNSVRVIRPRPSSCRSERNLSDLRVWSNPIETRSARNSRELVRLSLCESSEKSPSSTRFASCYMYESSEKFKKSPQFGKDSRNVKMPLVF
jgi:hypothetical protein